MTNSNKILPLLSLETSGDLCSVALKLNENDYYQNSVKQKYVHSEKIMIMIDRLFETSGIGLSDAAAIAVSIGPGSFTGLRIGLAAAKGLAAGSGLPIIPVPTYEALAFRLIKYLADKTKFAIVNRVNIEELYAAEFIKSGNYYKITKPVSLINKQNMKMTDSNDIIYFGNAVENKLQNSISAPDAADIADWAYFFGEDFLTSQYDYLEPNYLKEFIGKRKK